AHVGTAIGEAMFEELPSHTLFCVSVGDIKFKVDADQLVPLNCRTCEFVGAVAETATFCRAVTLNAPAFDKLTSPVGATAVAILELFPTQILAGASDEPEADCIPQAKPEAVQTKVCPRAQPVAVSLTPSETGTCPKA